MAILKLDFVFSLLTFCLVDTKHMEAYLEEFIF